MCATTPTRTHRHLTISCRRSLLLGLHRYPACTPRHVIDDVEDAQAPAAGELVVDEVERPAGIWLGLDENGCAGAYRLAATSAFAHGQSLLAIEPVDAVDAGWLALVPQQDEEPTIAEPATLVGEIAQTGA